MVRRVASQVHKQVVRLQRKDYLDKEPLWLKAVLEHPPLPLPPKAPPARFPPDGKPYDLPPRRAAMSDKMLKKPEKARTSPIFYLEDEVRRQFFRDHPFEAFRARSMVESGLIESEHPVRGEAWTRLSQRGRNPSPEEYVCDALSLYICSSSTLNSAIRFAVNLYEYHGKPLTDAYTSSIAQFRALRAEQHIASQVAIAEAQAYGGVFKAGELEKGFLREQEYLKSWEQRQYTEQESMEARKRWKAIIERNENKYFTRGAEYVRLWREGIRPDYSPALSAPVEAPAAPAELGADFLNVQPRLQ